MASSKTLIITTLLIFSLITISSNAASSNSKLPKPKAIHFPIRKNQTTLQYYTTYAFGNYTMMIDSLIDLQGSSVWFECTSYVSPTYKRTPCGSKKCKKAKGVTCTSCMNSPLRPGCSNNTCAVYVYNPFNQVFTSQEFGEDTMMGVTSTDGRYVWFNYEVPKFQFNCADSAIVDGLPGDSITKGLVGLGRSQVSLASQISSAFKLAQKFALCLPSSSEHSLGDIFIGGGPYYMPPSIGDMSLSLVNTPLVINPVTNVPHYFDGDASDEYFINVKWIEIGGKRVAFNSSLLSFDKNGGGGTTISTIVPYTVLHAAIYKRLLKDFIKATSKKNIKRVTSIEPFGACFDSKTAPMTITGPAVPNIDLILEGNNTVKFTLYGSNSMVEVKKNVICLAFIDGGVEPRTSIVLGGHQLENRILEFDLGASKLGFSSPLVMSNASCSNDRVF